MRITPSNNRDESFDRWRQRMLAETERFIEWGLQHPEEVERIPAVPVGQTSFSERVKSIFWNTVLGRIRDH